MVPHLFTHVGQHQFRINNTVAANAAIATGPALLWAPRCFVLNFSLLLYLKAHIRIYVPEPRQTFRIGLYFFACAIACRNFIRWKQFKFFVLSENLLLLESPFHIVNCLKSFNLKSFFAHTLNLLRAVITLQETLQLLDCSHFLFLIIGDCGLAPSVNKWRVFHFRHSAQCSHAECV